MLRHERKSKLTNYKKAFVTRLLLAALALLSLVVNSSSASAQGIDAHIPKHLDCRIHPCVEVLSGAVRFEPGPQKAPYMIGLDESGKTIGWVVLSTDVVDIKAYSGKPLVTLVGLNPEGVITGARVVSHSEPILLVGIPESKLHDFAAFYKDKPATEKIVVGTADDGVTSVDVISGATVTALAQNQTILETAITLGRGVGAISARQVSGGQFVQGNSPWTWQQMWEEGALGRLYVRDEEMGIKGSDGAFIDLFFTIADAPHIGIGLLGPSEYRWYKENLKEDEHLVVVLGNGSSSFKGSGFVRGGIFDRVRIEQGMRTILFTDKDYKPLSGAFAPDAPAFKEGAVFIARRGALDPGETFDMVFLGSVYNHQGGFSRDFKTTTKSLRLPETVFKRAAPSADQSMWRQAWKNSGAKKWILALILATVTGLFIARRWLTGSLKRLRIIHLSFMTVAFLGIGLGLGVQPSVTQIMTLVGGLIGEWRWELFLSEPLVFFFWIFIAIVSLIWGRGVFCGWLCPYGAMTELLFKVGEKLGFKHFELPDPVHKRAIYLRYFVLVGLLATYLYRPELGERMAEIEPFKSTFYVAPWSREIGFFAWWLTLIVLSFVWWRPFCRYVCPLGAGLAIFNSFRISGPYRRKACSSCSICTRGCEPRAIDGDGVIDSRECLSCMECEANFSAVEVCPPLIGIERLLKKPELSDADSKKLEHFREQKERL